MKFHEWISLYSAARANGDQAALVMSESEWFKHQQDLMDMVEDGEFEPEMRGINGVSLTGKLGTSMFRHQFAAACCEHLWYSELRPYYKAFPCIVDALQKIRLDTITRELDLQDRVFSVRFAEDSEPVCCGNKLPSMLTGVSDGMLFFTSQFRNSSGTFATCVKFFLLDSVATVDEWIEKTIGSAVEDFGISQEDAVRINCLAARIALTCHLMSDDPSIITPDVLSSDRDRYSNETDEAWKQRAVDRARRRGVVGWSIGADYELCPHYRRPHFALRHTGKGRAVPRIVPIKGAVVHRSRLTEVPTGWMTPDGREVEPARA